MPISFSEMVDIFKRSYSKLYGGIDTRYIFMTNVVEINPGEIAFTCEVLVPSNKRETVNTISRTINEMDATTDLFIDRFYEAKQEIVGAEPLTVKTSTDGAYMLSGFEIPTTDVTKRTAPLPVFFQRDTIPPVIVTFDTYFA